MQAVYTSVFLAILCTAGVSVSGIQPAKTKGRNSTTNEQKRPSKGFQCGISESAPNSVSRIVGGEEAKPHSWPWQVLIRCRNFEKGNEMFRLVDMCSGSLLSEDWVITAAHCMLQLPRDIFLGKCHVLLGKHYRKRNESTELIRKIDDYFIHPEYIKDPGNLKVGADLALLKLKKPVKFNDAIQPICLPFGLLELPHKKTCYITGWGMTRPEKLNETVKEKIEAYSDGLKQLHMEVEGIYCPSPIAIGRRVICTLRWDEHAASCIGDSGGPLVCQEPNQKWYLRGIISNGDCDFYTLSTKVASFLQWIQKKTSLY